MLIYRDDGLFVVVDPEIARLYRSMIPKSIKLNKPRFHPHITVVRNEVISLPLDLRNKQIDFDYSPIICHDNTYWWLNVVCDYLKQVRLELGLEETSPWTRPPDDSDFFHCTIGNTK